MSDITEYRLSNGAQVVIDPIAPYGTLAIGFNFNVGTRHETEEENGLAHFLEHNIFNGTSRSNGHEIATRADQMGAFINAETGKTSTNYYMVGQADSANDMVDLLSEIVIDPAFPEEAFETERGAVIEEIKTSQDNPDDVFRDTLSSVLYPDQALGRTILGPIQNISTVPRQSMIGFFERNYHSENLGISIAGQVDPDKILKRLDERLEDFRHGVVPISERAFFGKPGYHHFQQDGMQQIRTSMVFESPDISHPSFAALRLGAAILGGSMASPLQKEVRKERGLVYSIYANASSWPDIGNFSIDFSCSPEKVESAMTVTRDVLSRCVDMFSDAALNAAKGRFTTGMRLGSEGVENRMKSYASEMTYFGRPLSLAEHVDKIQRVKLQDVKDSIAHVVSTRPIMLTMGSQDVADSYHRFTNGLG